MAYDILLKISGKPADPETFHALVETAEESGVLVNFDSRPDASEIVELFQVAAKAGKPVELTIRDGELLPDVRDKCQEAGLGYAMSYGPEGIDEYTDGIAWRPGMASEVSYGYDEESNLRVTLGDVQSAAKRGIEAINELTQAVATASTPGKVEFDEGFIEAYDEHVESLEEGSDGPAAPTP